MRDTIWNKRIPTLFGLLFILFGIIATTYLVKTGVIVIGRATPSNTPENIRITNIQDTSFTVSYTTSQNTTGTLSFGKDSTLPSVSIDDRDQDTGSVNFYTTHHITVKNLEQQTKYYFAIVSGQTTFMNNESPFEVTTAPTLSEEPSEQQPMVGKIVLPDGTVPKEGIVYVTAPSAQTLSILLKSDGGYILPLNSIRILDLSSYFTFNNETSLQILAISESLKSEVNVLANAINPVPKITLSKNYDFTLSDTPIASVSSQLKFPTFSATGSAIKEPQINSPKKDEKFTDTQPLFKGVAEPSSDVTVTIESEEKIQAKIQADKNGNWNFRPDKPLAPGEHTVTIQTRDKFGILKTIKQSFVVFAQGSQVQESATPSATPTIKISPTITPTIAKGATTTPTPTLTLTPTPTPIQTPTATPTIIVKTTPIITPPAVGDSALFVTGVAATITTAIGVLLFFLSRTANTSL